MGFTAAAELQVKRVWAMLRVLLVSFECFHLGQSFEKEGVTNQWVSYRRTKAVNLMLGWRESLRTGHCDLWGCYWVAQGKAVAMNTEDGQLDALTWQEDTLAHRLEAARGECNRSRAVVQGLRRTERRAVSFAVGQTAIASQVMQCTHWGVMLRTVSVASLSLDAQKGA